MVAVQVRGHRAHAVAEHTLQRHLERLEQRDLESPLAAVAATSAPMNPAPTTTTRDGVASRSARSARQSSSVRNVWMPARSGCPGSVADPRAGGDHQPVERDPDPSVQLDAAGREVEAAGGDTESPLDIQVVHRRPRR